MKIVTSLSFRGQCREAFEFYAKVLGGRITAAHPYSEAPPGMPAADPKYNDWLMHCWLEVGDQALMGADMDTAWAPNIDKPKNGFDVTLHTDDAAQARRWFDGLKEGGKVGMDFAETFWSPGYGSLRDRCGVAGLVYALPEGGAEGWGAGRRSDGRGRVRSWYGSVAPMRLTGLYERLVAPAATK
jgi:PhnB protein